MKPVGFILKPTKGTNQMAKGTALTEEQKAAKLKEKQAKFSELAGARLPKVLTALDGMIKLAAYSPNDVQKAFVGKQIQDKLAALSAAYAGKVQTSSAKMEIPMEAPAETKA